MCRMTAASPSGSADAPSDSSSDFGPLKALTQIAREAWKESSDEAKAAAAGPRVAPVLNFNLGSSRAAASTTWQAGFPTSSQATKLAEEKLALESSLPPPLASWAVVLASLTAFTMQWQPLAASMASALAHGQWQVLPAFLLITPDTAMVQLWQLVSQGQAFTLMFEFARVCFLTADCPD